MWPWVCEIFLVMAACELCACKWLPASFFLTLAIATKLLLKSVRVFPFKHFQWSIHQQFDKGPGLQGTHQNQILHSDFLTFQYYLHTTKFSLAYLTLQSASPSIPTPATPPSAVPHSYSQHQFFVFSLNSLLNEGETGHKMFSFHWRWEVHLLVARSPLMSKLRFHHASLQPTYWPPTWGAPSSQKSQVGEERHKFVCLSPNAVSAVIVIVRVRGDMMEWNPVEEKVKEFSSKMTALEDIPCQRLTNLVEQSTATIPWFLFQMSAGLPTCSYFF